MSELCADADDGEVVVIRLAGDTDSGGDAACWANRVCAECGRLNEVERPEVCEACGAPFADR